MEFLLILLLLPFFIFALLFPLTLSVIVYLVPYIILRILIWKKKVSVDEKKWFYYHLIFFCLAVATCLIVGIIDRRIDEFLAWNLIPGIATYLASVATYMGLKHGGKKKEALMDEKEKKKRKKRVKLIVTLVAITVFVIAEIIGMSTVELTLM